VRTATALAPLSVRAYRLLWLGQTVSSAGDALVQVALVFAILRSGGDASDIGYVIAIQVLVRVAFILAGGVWADRLPRQLLMLSSDLLRMTVQAALAVLLLASLARVWELGLGAAFYGAAQSFFGPASTGLLPQLVPAGQLHQANALMGFSRGLTSVAGPAVAGLLIAAFGPGVAFAVDAATFAVSAVALTLLRPPPRRPADRTPFLADLAAGWREIVIRRWYWLNLIAHALWNLAIPAYLVLGPVIALRTLGGASAWGAISACWAAGAVLGGAIALRVRPPRPLVAGNLVLLLGTLPLLALAGPLRVWVIGVAAALGSAAVVFTNTVWTATMQRLIPDQVRSRVDSYDWLISLVVMPAGLAAVGPVAAAAGPAATLTGAALVLGLPCALVALLPAIRAVRMPAEESGGGVAMGTEAVLGQAGEGN
jgi:MFS family permease